MNPDQEMQAEAMDLAQDEILRLQEALAVEKEAHVDTAKMLVEYLGKLEYVFENIASEVYAYSECHCDHAQGITNCAYCASEKFCQWYQSGRDTAGDDYVRKESVRPIVQVLRNLDNNDDVYHMEAQQELRQALEQAKLLGL